jgi:hypothetical protein
MSEESQITAKTNGQWGEEQAQILLAKDFPDLKYIQETIDFMTASGILIEVKTCQETIDTFPRKRRGRYLLDMIQHEILLQKEGYYFFLVKAGPFLLRAKLVKASEIIFKRQINWSHIHV